MAQIFHPSTNTFAKATIFGAVFIAAGIASAAGVLMRSSYVTGVGVVRDQPVPFSHDHHVSGLGIDCRYCHTSVEKSSFAGIPSTEVCMGCHSQIWKDSPLLAPVRESFRKGEPLQWTRVHDLPDFVYFNHSIHVAKGIGCESCHGRVDKMPLMRKSESLHMEWCLECHRHPQYATRDKSDIFRFGVSKPNEIDMPNDTLQSLATPQGQISETTAQDEAEAHPLGGPRAELASAYESLQNGESLVKQYGIVTKQLSDCVICHR